MDNPDDKTKTNEIPDSVDSNNLTTDATKVGDPPLIMQSSNLPIEDGLDIRYDGGGNGTSNENHKDSDDMDDNQENVEPAVKKRKTTKDTSVNRTQSNCLNSPIDKSSSVDVASLLEKDKNNTDFADSENDKTSDVQASSNTGVLEFDILDEFESNDNDNEENYSSDSSDISINELDALLDASLQSNKRSSARTEEQQHEEKQKVILKVRGRDHFDVLPEGWIEVTHNSGMPIYLHKPTRVCSVSKPYFLGPGSTRKHEIPISAIPCLHYLRELEKERNAKENENPEEGNDSLPSAKLESVKDTKQSSSLDYMTVREYCMKRFEFQTITIKRFKTWSGRRLHQKQLRQKQRPTLPDSTKLITCPLPPISDKNAVNSGSTKREFIMNPSGKSPVCILHEYAQHTLRVQPKYIFKELENASTPYGAVVMIDDMEYGYGYGSSKKQAKSEAAKAALNILIPKMKMFSTEGKSEEQDVEFFDQVRVEDPRVCELSVKAGQPYPYQILLECLKRNYGMGDTEIYFTMRNLKHQKNEFLMTVGKHSVSVICQNKRDGKHRASQAILQLLHPHVTSWGSLLRMYGKGSCKTLKEKKEEEQRITELQSQACANKPNISILNKLKEEMLKYREKMQMKKPIGKLIPEQMQLSTSDSNLRNVEL